MWNKSSFVVIDRNYSITYDIRYLKTALMIGDIYEKIQKNLYRNNKCM